MVQTMVMFGALPDTLEYPPFTSETSKPTLGPDLSVNLPTGIKLSAAEYDDIVGRTRMLYVYGIACYEDLLGKKHETKWCLEYNGANSAFVHSRLHNLTT
jgi:hypothetical protein